MRATPRTWWFRTSAASLLGAAAVGFLAGRAMQPAKALAGPPEAKPTAPTASPLNGDPSKRLIAYLFNGKVQITREDLGEYLIARMNPEKIDLIVNKTIIETACRERGIEVTAAEIDAAFKDDCTGISVDRKQFIDNVLKKYGKTEYEWREDVIKPRLQLGKLCRLDVKVTDEEIKKAFDAKFGPRVEGAIILWPKGPQESYALKMYDEIRSSDEKFQEVARTQAVSSLAATGGRIQPFARGSGTDPKLESEAFMLKPGQLSTLISTKEGTLVFKLINQIPADTTVKFEDWRERLSKMVYEQKVAQEIPKHFKVLRDAADPKILMTNKAESSEDLKRSAENLLQTGATVPAKK